MSDYKNTLNLPQTKFSMKGNLVQREPNFLKEWDRKKLYEKMLSKREGKPSFILHDGPPYANGPLHLGHALNKILKDIIVKSKALSGFYTPYVPGWDCHGLPIELNVEKKHGKAGQKLSHRAFRQKCRVYAQSQIKHQKESFIRLGILADWEQSYHTMDPVYEAVIVRSLAKIIDQGHLVQGFKPVYWCYECRSALAEAEVIYQSKQSPAIDVAFTVVDVAQLKELLHVIPKDIALTKVALAIWTTTPWTLPANEAVVVHPDVNYVLIRGHVGHLIIAENLIKSVCDRYGLVDATVLAKVSGTALAGLYLAHPLYDKRVPVILGEHVTADAGTGAVHTAPSHGEDDYYIGKKYQLPLVTYVNEKGVFSDHVPEFSGQFIFKANPLIIQALEQKNVLLAKANIEHSYPHCWRHKTPILFRATPQWFVAMDQAGLRQKTLAAIEGVDWLPDWGEARIYHMIENRPDWCVSRQRTWCMPMPLVIHCETGALHPKTPLILEQVAQKIERFGLEAWYNFDLSNLLNETELANYKKSSDTLDVWFDSGISHTAVLAARETLSLPADLYLEGSDQHRGWFNSSLMTSMAMYEKAPYKAVLTHGYTVDKNGRKMSKSLGNVVTPEEIIQKYGADVLRLWISATNYRSEIVFSDETIQRTAETYRRIRNTLRYLLSNLFDFEPDQHQVPPQKMLLLDQLVLQRAQRLQTDIIAAYERYQFHLVYQHIKHFCSVDLGGFYLDVIKDRQYTCQKNALARRSCQSAMYHSLNALLRWLAPILSFTAEEAWHYQPGVFSETVFLEDWYVFPEMTHERIDWETLLQIREWSNVALEEKRNKGVIRAGLDAKIWLHVSADRYERLAFLAKELCFLCLVSEVHLMPLAQTVSDEYRVYVEASEYSKCVRCWHKHETVGTDKEHPSLCSRCIENVAGSGENRQFI